MVGTKYVAVTLVVPVLNESKRIGLMLDSILSGSSIPDEILVIDGGSTDDTVAVAKEALVQFGGVVRFLDNPRVRVQHALNIGLEHASNPLLVRVDGHCTVSPNYVETVTGHLRSGRYSGAGGRKVAIATSAQGAANAAALSSPIGVGGSRYHYLQELEAAEHVPFGAYRVEDLREVGGWDPDLDVNQDFELDYRLREAGKKLVLDPKAEILWHARETASGLFRQHRRYGRGRAMVVRKHPSSVSGRHIAPSAAGVVGVVWAILAPAKAVGASAASICATYLALGRFGVKSSSSESQVSPVRVACALSAMHAGFALGFAEGTLGVRPAGSQVSQGDAS